MKQDEKQQNYELAEKLLAEQNFPAALIVGAVAAVLAAAIYGIVTSLWGFSYGFAAAGIGIIVGFPMQYLGRGIRMKFAVAASLYTIAGCVIGNLFRVIMSQARVSGISPLEVLQSNAFSTLTERAISNLSLVDLVFWFVGVFAAAFLAKRPLSRAERLAIGMYDLRS